MGNQDKLLMDGTSAICAIGVTEGLVSHVKGEITIGSGVEQSVCLA